MMTATPKTRVVISADEFNEARKKIREAKGSGTNVKIVFTSEDDSLTRKVLEKETIDVLLISQKGRKDKQKQRDSGFNQVLARTAKKKSVALGINLDEILEASGKEKSEILARIRQNITLAKKNKLKITFISSGKTDPYNLKALGLILGMPTWMTKEI